MTFPSKLGANYVDSITVLILLPLIWIFIGIRIYVRGFVTKKPGWDDVTAVIAAVSSNSPFRKFDIVSDYRISLSIR
jgi:hypothetical protein